MAEWPTTPIDPFFNVNTPADAAEATRIAAQQDGARASSEALPGKRG
jgi:molybdopterin-guanine dinucleotide biosynthesis protein A